jgi:hypothetical protein
LSEVLTVRADESLIRGVHPEQWNTQEDRPSSAAFNAHELSVDREEMRSVADCCNIRPLFGHVRIAVEQVLRLGLTVKADPIGTDTLPFDTTPSESYDPAHALVLGSKKAKQRLRNTAITLFRPGECPDARTTERGYAAPATEEHAEG